jgi:hypothetical protein
MSYASPMIAEQRRSRLSVLQAGFGHADVFPHLRANFRIHLLLGASTKNFGPMAKQHVGAGTDLVPENTLLLPFEGMQIW